MQELGVDTHGYFGPADSHPVAERFRGLWADNGNFLSVQYSGTGIQRHTIG